MFTLGKAYRSSGAFSRLFVCLFVRLFVCLPVCVIWTLEAFGSTLLLGT